MTRLAASALGGRNVVAFLDCIAHSELGQLEQRQDADGGYRVIVGSTPARPILTYDYTRHPRIVVTTAWGRSNAAGRYQVMAAVTGAIKTDTWDWASRAANVTDFSPEGQDLVGAYLLRHRGALDAIAAGQFDVALRKCAPEWASLPGAGYGQRENAADALRSYYLAAGGTLA